MPMLSLDHNLRMALLGPQNGGNAPLELDQIKSALVGLLQQVSEIEAQKQGAEYALQDRVAILDRFALISQTDTRGVIEYANPKFCEVSGYTLEELVGRPHNIVRHPDMPKETFKELWDTLKAGKIWQGEIKNRRKDGSHYWVLATVGPVRNQKGEIAHYLSIRVDITELKETRDQNLQLEEELLINFQAAAAVQQLLMPNLRTRNPEKLPLPHFILWQPHHAVSGDFFWSHQEKNRLIFSVGDAMGHGVFGGLLSVLFMQKLRHFVQLSGISTPDRLAEEVDSTLSDLFRHNADRPLTVDAFVGSLDIARRRLNYVSLKGKAYHFREGRGEKLHAYPFSFGESLGSTVEDQELLLEPGDRLYFLSDGLCNQVCRETGKPLGSKAVAQILERVQAVSIQRQKEAILEAISKCRQTYPQSDDMVIVGLEIA